MSGYSGVQLKTALPHSPQKLRVRGVPESVVGSLYDLRCGRPERIVKPWLFYYFQSSLLSWVWVDFWMGIGDRDVESHGR